MRIEGFKVCNTCNVEKSTEEFHLSKSCPLGVTNKCKSCVSIARKADYYKNQERNIQYSRNYYSLPENKENAKTYINENKEYISKRQKKYYKYVKKPKPLFTKLQLTKIPGTIQHLKASLRALVISSFKRKKHFKKCKTTKILGCSFEEFKIYIESLWEPWMNWSNYGNQNGIAKTINYSWELDHIIPISSAKTREDIIRLNHYTNFQPLCSYTNRWVKRNKLL